MARPENPMSAPSTRATAKQRSAARSRCEFGSKSTPRCGWNRVPSPFPSFSSSFSSSASSLEPTKPLGLVVLSTAAHHGNWQVKRESKSAATSHYKDHTKTVPLLFRRSPPPSSPLPCLLLRAMRPRRPLKQPILPPKGPLHQSLLLIWFH